MKTDTEMESQHSDLIERINKQKWKFATTYAKTAPHEYILKEWNPDLWNEIAKLIDEQGYEGKFWNTKFRYYKIGKYKYWHYEIVLNRARING